MTLKKLFASILSVLMLVSLIPLSATAEKGPYSGDYFWSGYAGFFKADENGEVIRDDEGAAVEAVYVYKEGAAVDPGKPGISYDLASNTLTLTDCSMPEYIFEANMMGEDFRIVVKGDCALGKIGIWGYGYGGSLAVEGDGKLRINEGRIFDAAVIFYPEGAPELFFGLGKDVNVDMYSNSGNVVIVYDAQSPVVPSEFFRFENGVPASGRAEHIRRGEKEISGFLIDSDSADNGGCKCICKSDPDGIYGASKYFREIDEHNAPIYLGYYVYRYVYSESLGRYFRDYSFGEGGSIDMTFEEFDSSDYELVYDEHSEEVWNELNAPWAYSSSKTVYTDGENEYVICNSYEDETVKEIACTIEEIPEIPGEHVFSFNNEIDPDSLEPVIGEWPSGAYNTVIPGNEYHYAAVAGSNTFTDVPAGSWFEAAALWCNSKGYITGTGAAAFSPNLALTRGMFVQILARVAVGSELDGYTYNGKFTDVKAEDWYAKAVQWAVDNGVTGGTNDTTFSPNAPVTREQLATFFFAYAKSEGYDVSASAPLDKYTDADQISSWAVNAIKWAVAEGLISGTSDTTVSPKMSATRAQAAVIFKNFVEIYAAKQK